MGDKPKSFWTRTPKGWLGYLSGFLLLLVLTGAVCIAVGLFFDDVQDGAFLGAMMAGIIFAAAILVLAIVSFIRWVVCWRNLRRLLFWIGTCIALGVGISAEEYWRGKHAWHQFKAEWEAKGEKFDFKAFIPPPVPDEQNFAMTPIVASCYEHILDKNGKRISPARTNVVNRLKMDIFHNGYPPRNSSTNPAFGSWQKGQLTDLNVWQFYYRHPESYSRYEGEVVSNSFPVSPMPQTPAADVLLALSRYDSAINELREASRLPFSRFPLDYSNQNPGMMVLPHLAAMNECSQVLQLRALAHLESGKADKALEDVRLMFSLINALHGDPFLVSQSVRAGVFRMLLQPVYEGLVKRQWTESQLVVLDEELAKLDFLADYKPAMRAELALTCGFIDCFRKNQQLTIWFFFGAHMGEPSQSTWILKTVTKPVSTGWFYQNEYRYAREMVETFISRANESNRTFSVNMKLRITDESNYEECCHWSWAVYDQARRFWIPSIRRISQFAHAQSSLDLSRTAIALERYRLAHGQYPESLDMLAPKFITKVPHDVIGGQPLKYRRTADGQFVLYSIGWNETDDGGVVGLWQNGSVDYDTGDWVWRYPVK